jgi:hypothetical protein
MNDSRTHTRTESPQAIATTDQLYAFLRQHYKNERFEDRNNSKWEPNYSQLVTHSTMESLKLHGYSCVSRYESATGKAIFFDRSLGILDHETTLRALRGELK